MRKAFILGIIFLVVSTLVYFFYYTQKQNIQLSESKIFSTEKSGDSYSSDLSPSSHQNQQGDTMNTQPKSVDLTTNEQDLSKVTAVLETSKGTIKYKFYSKDAPKTVQRIVELIQEKFYDGLKFHRVVPKFVIQGGDPSGNGTGGSGQKLPAEFNKQAHKEGTVAMARAQDVNSADSQFYISLGTHPHLDGQYTVFGQVVEGIEVIHKIEPNDKIIKITLE